MGYVWWLFFLFVFTFMLLRRLIWSVKYASKNEYKKRLKTRETLLEWFLYSRFRDIIPKSILIGYFSHFIIHCSLIAFGILFCIFTSFSALEVPFQVFRATAICDFFFFWIIYFKCISAERKGRQKGKKKKR